MAGVGRDVWRSPGQTPLLKQDHMETVAQDHAQMAFDYHQGWRAHNFFMQLVPGLGHPRSSVG